MFPPKGVLQMFSFSRKIYYQELFKRFQQRVVHESTLNTESTRSHSKSKSWIQVSTLFFTIS